MVTLQYDDIYSSSHLNDHNSMDFDGEAGFRTIYQKSTIGCQRQHKIFEGLNIFFNILKEHVIQVIKRTCQAFID